MNFGVSAAAAALFVRARHVPLPPVDQEFAPNPCPPIWLEPSAAPFV